MQQTTKYKFNLIETSDTFSPAPLNDNAQAMETQLDRVEAETAAQLASLAATEAADKAALEQALAGASAALQTAIGSGGENCRFAYGSYVGTGTSGPNGACSLTFDFEPCLLLVANYIYDPVVLIRPNTSSSAGTVTWGKQSVSWYVSSYSDPSGAQFNTKDITYYYIAFGKSL